MQDQFGNQLNLGDTVIYFSTGLYHTAHVGVIKDFTQDKGVKLRSEKGRNIHRPADTLIAYTGIVP